MPALTIEFLTASVLYSPIMILQDEGRKTLRRILTVIVAILLILPIFLGSVPQAEAADYPHDPRGEITNITVSQSPPYYQGETLLIYVEFRNPTATTYHYLVALNIFNSTHPYPNLPIYDSHTEGEDIHGDVNGGEAVSWGPWEYTLPHTAATGTWHVLAGLRLHPWDPELDYMGLSWCEPEKTFMVKPSHETIEGASGDPYDYDGDSYPDSVRIQVLAQTNSLEDVDVEAYGDLKDPLGNVVDNDGPGLWTVPAGWHEWSFDFYLFVPGDSPAGTYTVDLYLYDATHRNDYPDPEDVKLDAISCPLYPPGYVPNPNVLLVEKYFPVYYFSAGENWYPCSFYFDGNGQTWGQLQDNEDNYDPDAPPPYYAYIHVTENSTHKTIQYWLYYVWNYHWFWIWHDTDWDSTVFIILEKTAGNPVPVEIVYYFHKSKERLSWNDWPEIEDSTHAVVYVALGSHGAYSSPEEMINNPKNWYISDEWQAGGRVLRESDFNWYLVGDSEGHIHDYEGGNYCDMTVEWIEGIPQWEFSSYWWPRWFPYYLIIEDKMRPPWHREEDWGRVEPLPNDQPVLSSGYVTPTSGGTSTLFYYYVHYYDPEGVTPSNLKHLCIDGTEWHTMSLHNGTASNGFYRCILELPVGNHNYSFKFSDGVNDPVALPTSDTYSGPPVVSSGHAELAYDDGVAEAGYGPTLDLYTYAVRFHTPTDLPCKLSQVKYYIYDYPASFYVDIRDGSLQQLYYELVTPTQEGWFVVDLTAEEIFVQGSFYVGIKYSQLNEPKLGADVTDPDGESGESPNSFPTPNLTSLDWMIRAYVILQGDVNGDGVVDSNDLDQMGSAYGSTVGQTHWDTNADVNSDEIVDVHDLWICGECYGHTSTGFVENLSGTGVETNVSPMMFLLSVSCLLSVVPHCSHSNANADALRRRNSRRARRYGG